MAKVQLEGNQTNGYRLIVDGAPFFIKGAGLEFGQLKSLANAGGNTFRTWRVALCKTKIAKLQNLRTPI